MKKSKKANKIDIASMSREERIFAWSQSHRTSLSKKPISLPTRDINVGDKVLIGNLDDVTVEALFEDGRWLVVSHLVTPRRYGQQTGPSYRDYGVWAWFDTIPNTGNSWEKEFGREPYIGSYSQSSLESLIRRAVFEELVDNPDYQRGYVWTLEDKQRFILSCLSGLDIGKFVFLIDRPTVWTYEVLDGKQRLNALKEFVLGHYRVNDKLYWELTSGDRYCMTNRTVQFVDIDKGRISKKDILRLFLELNCAGVPQTEAHLTHVKELLNEELLFDDLRTRLARKIEKEEE